jgi:cyclic-di-GMP phosphodiesterase, flagellum assembly factor TipF
MVGWESNRQEPGPPVQGLVYTFIALAALAVGVATYFGLTFTPIEALVTALCVGTIAVVFVERQLRQRSQARLEKAIDDLGRLLATDAQAGNVLSQRVNALVDQNTGKRLESVEADLSVLGTAVRQVAEAVADIEETNRKRDVDLPPAPPAPVVDDDTFPEAVIPLDTLRRALDEGRLICHVQPIATLPQRSPHGYDIVPRLMLEDGDLADPPDFLPRRGGTDLLVRIEGIALAEGIAITRRSRNLRQSVPFYIPISRASLGDPDAMEALIAAIDANRAIADVLMFALPESDWPDLKAPERAGIGNIARRGIGFSLTDSRTLRFDFGDLQGLGFRSVRVDASRFIGRPEQFTDFHISDVADYARRYGIEIIATGAVGEQQLIALYEDGITLAQGPLIGAVGPARPDLTQTRSGLAPRRAGG